MPGNRVALRFPILADGRRNSKADEGHLLGKIKGWSKLMPKLVKKSGVKLTLHDLRRSLKTHVRELGFNSDIASLLVGHARDNFSRRATTSPNSSEFRRKASEAYATMIAEAVLEMGNVVMLEPPAKKLVPSAG